MIKIQYNGKWPCLCCGQLVVFIDDVEYKFTSCCLRSGGECYFINDYADEVVAIGEWTIGEWPDNFPEEYKEETLEKINNVIPQGCCGGCL